MAVTMRAKRPFKYKGRKITYGDMFAVTDSNAKKLAAFDFAEIVHEEKEKAEEAPPSYATTAIKAEDSPAKVASDLEDKTKKQLQELLTERGQAWRFTDNKAALIKLVQYGPGYMRRDMRAQD